MSIKIIEGLKLWEVMKRAEEGEPWAYHPNTVIFKSHWTEVADQSITNLAAYIAQCWPVAIIDTTEPVIEWDKFDYDFFNQYGGLPLCSYDYEDSFFTNGSPEKIFDIMPVLRTSPFYCWQGGKCPVPGNVEVEVIYRDDEDREKRKASDCRWTHSPKSSEEGHDPDVFDCDIIAFRLTGNVL